MVYRITGLPGRGRGGRGRAEEGTGRENGENLLAWFLAIPVGLEEKGVYLAIVIAESVMTIVGILFFRRGKWKKQEVECGDRQTKAKE